MKPVAILGVGPAGLMAAQAVALSGRPVALFGQPNSDGTAIKRSVLGGAQFLHQPIPGINDEDEPDAVIRFHLAGGVGVYRKKIYGDANVPFVSMEFLHEGLEQPAWNLKATYDKLWELLGVDSIGNVQVINSEWLDDAMRGGWFDFVISTIPAPALCRIPQAEDAAFRPPHLFVGQEIQITNESMMGHDNTIYYDGTIEHSWYRTSNLFGHGSTEYGAHVRTPMETFRVTKPIRTNCDCYGDSILRAGRYGTWTKGVLTHHAFTDAIKALH